MGVGSNIRRLRLEAGLTQEELAKRVGVARSTITQWERGWTQPRMGMVHKLATVFNTTNSVIVSEVGSEKDYDNKQSANSATLPSVTIEYQAGSREATKLPKQTYVSAQLLTSHPHAKAYVLEDDSMSRVIPQGMAAIYDPDLSPTNGQIVVARTSDKQVHVRRWYAGASTVLLVADSYAPHDDIVLAADDKAEVLGVVVSAQAVDDLL